MALMITDECISCGVCLPECPNEAIVEDNGVFRIRGGRCTECAGFFDEPKCRELCPVSASCPIPAVLKQGRCCLKSIAASSSESGWRRR